MQISVKLKLAPHTHPSSQEGTQQSFGAEYENIYA